MDMLSSKDVTVKSSNYKYVKNMIKLLKLTNSSKIVPIDSELYKIEDKINACKSKFTDNDEELTIALSSPPTSFSSNETIEEVELEVEGEGEGEGEKYFNPDKFTKISILGSGSFGKVYLSEYEENQYAIKSLIKAEINEQGMEQILSEKEILMKMSDPFIVKLYGTCQTKDELYFITELLEYGDLFSAIYHGDQLSHESCVFYGSGILMGLDFIHSKNIVYRDLKSENIMIGENGYPKIIDFGLAKQLPYAKIDNGILQDCSKCYTLCGTPEYFAPELVNWTGYDDGVDIWAFGVLLYEMIFRTTPFDEAIRNSSNINSNNNNNIDYLTQLFTNISLCGKNGINITKKIDRKTDGTSNMRKLITQLLSGDVTKRLGKYNTPVGLLSHPYFLSTSLQVDALYNQSIEAPIFQPQHIGRDIETAPIIKQYAGDQTMFQHF